MSGFEVQSSSLVYRKKKEKRRFRVQSESLRLRHLAPNQIMSSQRLRAVTSTSNMSSKILLRVMRSGLLSNPQQDGWRRKRVENLTFRTGNLSIGARGGFDSKTPTKSVVATVGLWVTSGFNMRPWLFHLYAVCDMPKGLVCPGRATFVWPLHQQLNLDSNCALSEPYCSSKPPTPVYIASYLPSRSCSTTIGVF